MLKTIIKRDGSREPAQPIKINKWLSWGAIHLRDRVEWSTAVTSAISRCREEEHSQTLQLYIVEELVRIGDWAHCLMAGRLFAVWLQKKIHGDRIPTVAEKMAELSASGLGVWMNYSPEELATINDMIDHQRDFDMAEFQIKYIRSKYAIQNRHSGVEYETPQFVYMRMAMELAETEPTTMRLVHVKNYYDHFSLGRINAPTPNFNNLGTKHRGFASCCLFASGDSIKSLAAGDHIAYMMTANSAGIGGTIMTRTLGDPIRHGAIIHGGKLGYYDAQGKLVHANRQGSRGGAMTQYYPAFDPEVESITMAQNPRTAENKRIRTINFAMSGNSFLAKKAAMPKAEDRMVFLFTSYSAPELFNLFYSGDIDKFETEYLRLEADPGFHKTYMDARKIIVLATTQSFEVGTLFFFNAEEANRHTPFKDPIRSSNLCLAGDTLVLVKDPSKEQPEFVTLESLVDNFEGKEVWSMNVETSVKEFKPITAAACTNPSAKVIRVCDPATRMRLTCTPDHKIYTPNRGYVEAAQLTAGDRLWFNYGDQSLADLFIQQVEEPIPVFDITVEGNSNFFANNTLVHNCTEIMEPTAPYEDIRDLYLAEDHGRGEVAMCSLGGLVPSRIKNDTEYRSAAYYCLKMIDKCIELSNYPLPHIGFTAKARMSAGVGIVGLAHYLAARGLKYDTQEGRDEIHRVAERHSYFLIEQSLRIAKERGLPLWSHKTKWGEGWLPIDTYRKTIDSVVTVGLQYDWETLRKQIMEFGGIGHSCLVTHMPTESSSKAAGFPNSVLPIRGLKLLKTDGSNAVDWCATDSDLLADDYQIAYEIETSDLIKVYGILQKFADQGLSADFYKDRTKDQNLYTDEMVQNYIDFCRYGLKSRYYVNSNVSVDTHSEFTSPIVIDNLATEEDRGCASGACTL